MLAQIVRRSLIAAPTMLAVVLVAFALIHIAPDGPFSGERHDSDAISRRVERAYHPGQPELQQFARYLSGALHGDLGPSMKYQDKSVADILADGLPISLLLCGAALSVALIVGVGFGVAAALGRNKRYNRAVMALAILGASAPVLVIGPIMVLVFGQQLHWLPAGGLNRDRLDIAYLTLPVLALAFPQIAVISRLTGASMNEALQSSAIRTARAKGMPERVVLWRYALPAAMPQVLAYLSPAIAGVLIGSFVIENLFQLPGVAVQFVAAAQARDYSTMLGVVVLYAALLIACNLVADTVRVALDPRLRAA
ncbi:MAG: ABC transporter permease [Pseudomonadota bacterium]